MSFVLVLIVSISRLRFSDLGINSFCIFSFTIRDACFFEPLAITTFVFGYKMHLAHEKIAITKDFALARPAMITTLMYILSK